MDTSAKLKVVVALGNPGSEYATTRHNAGWLFIDWFLKDEHPRWSKRPDAVFYNSDNQHGAIFLKPQSYMNLSGVATKNIVNYFKLSPEHLCVIHDEVDLPLGEVKLKNTGGSAGHKGIENVIAEIGTHNFTRIRIGVETREDKKIPSTPDFVLQKFTTEQLHTLETKSFLVAENLLKTWLEH